MTAKQPAKGGARKRPASSNAGAALTPEQIAAIATQAAIAAVAQLGSAPVQQVDGARIKPSDLDDEGKADAEEAEQIRRQQQAAKETAARAAELAGELIPLIVRARHMDVFRWLRGRGSDADLLKSILASHLAAALPAYREANGEVSASSRNIELLTDTRPVHK